MAKTTYTTIYKHMKTRRELPSPRGVSPVPDPVFEEIEYQVSINWGAVTRLALKAAGNRSRKSKMGPVMVEITAAKCGVGV